MITYLEAGDPSRDGHNISEVFAIEHNLPSTICLGKAYREGVRIMGFDFAQDVAADYEESYITKSHFDVLEQFLPNLADDICVDEFGDELDDVNDDDAHAYFTDGADSFINIWLKIAKLGHQPLEAKIINLGKDTIEVGGYGMFFS